MHFNTLTTVTSMVAILAQTSEANIGQGAGLLAKIFGEIGSGAWSVGVDIATKKAKRNIPYISKRVPQNTSPYPGVSDVEYQRCFDELTSTRVEVTSPASDVIQFDNVPAYCMNLANVLIGDGSGGPYALPCGSACLQYTGLTVEEFNELAVILQDLA